MLRCSFALVVAVSLCLTSVCLAESNYNTAGMQRHASHQVPWSYVDMNDWQGLCRTGREQSPITLLSINPNRVIDDPDLRAIQFSSNCHLGANAQVIVKNTDHGIHVGFVTVRMGKMKRWNSCFTRDPVTSRLYEFMEIDLHVGQEHHLDEVQASGEMHLKFRAADQADDTLLYMAIPLQVGRSNASDSKSGFLLDRVLTDGRLPPDDAMTSSAIPRGFSILEFFPHSEDTFYTYHGSLTQPPCTESVRWVLFTRPLTISPSSLQALQVSIAKSNLVPLNDAGNARVIQSINDRKVRRFRGVTVNPKEKEKIFVDGLKDQAKAKGRHNWRTTFASWKRLSLLSIVMITVIAALIGSLCLSCLIKRMRNPVVGVDARELRPMISNHERNAMYGSAV